MQHPSYAEFGNQLAEIAARHLCSAFSGAPQSTQVERKDGCVAVVTGELHPLGNFAAGLGSDSQADADWALERLGSVAAPSMMLYSHLPPNESVMQRLDEAGYAPCGAMPAMACEIDKLPRTSLSEDYRFFEVTEARDQDEWTKTLEVGYELPAKVAAVFHPGSCREMRFFAAAGPAGISSVSSLWLDNGVAGIYCVATLPDDRGKGIASHMTAEPLRIASQEGYKVGVLQSSELGYSVYQKLGFKHLGEVHMYLRMPDA